MSLAGSWSGAQASAALNIIGTEGPSPLVIDMGVPDNAATEGLCKKGIKRYPDPRRPCCHRLVPFPDLESAFGRSIDDEPTHLPNPLW